MSFQDTAEFRSEWGFGFLICDERRRGNGKGLASSPLEPLVVCKAVVAGFPDDDVI